MLMFMLIWVYVTEAKKGRKRNGRRMMEGRRIVVFFFYFATFGCIVAKVQRGDTKKERKQERMMGWPFYF